MQPIFKQYNQGQAELFPQRLDDFIGENDPVRLVNQVVDELGWNQDRVCIQPLHLCLAQISRKEQIKTGNQDSQYYQTD